jgi:hypothetical protein
MLPEGLTETWNAVHTGGDLFCTARGHELENGLKIDASCEGVTNNQRASVKG